MCPPDGCDVFLTAQLTENYIADAIISQNRGKYKPIKSIIYLYDFYYSSYPHFADGDARRTIPPAGERPRVFLKRVSIDSE